MNLYITARDYLRGNTGQETSSLATNVTTLSTAVSVGATSLPITNNLTYSLSIGDPVTIFDGGNSEVATVSAPVSSGNSISVNAILNNHSVQTILCTDGQYGSLSNAIQAASASVEAFCEQSLLSTPYTNEELSLRTLAANITNDGTLHIRPRHFPIIAVSALSLVTDVNDSLTLDATQCIINTRAMSIDVPVVSQIGNGPSLLILRPPLDQNAEGWVKVTYVAGYTYSTIPWDIKQACIWLTSDVLSDRQNATGASEMSQGKRRATQYVRSGKFDYATPLAIRAYQRLIPYKRLS